jgi:hypothetical protein
MSGPSPHWVVLLGVALPAGALVSALGFLVLLVGVPQITWWTYSQGGIVHHVGLWHRCDVDFVPQPRHCTGGMERPPPPPSLPHTLPPPGANRGMILH